jgi:hypothetical protein
VIQHDKRDQSVGELLGGLYHDTSNILRLEIELAKAEMSQKASRVGKNVGFLAAGGIVAYTGVLAIVAGIIGLLALLVPVWLSALIVGIVIAAVGGILIRSGLKTLQQEQAAPQKTIETLKEDARWMSDQRNR